MRLEEKRGGMRGEARRGGTRRCKSRGEHLARRLGKGLGGHVPSLCGIRSRRRGRRYRGGARRPGHRLRPTLCLRLRLRLRGHRHHLRERKQSRVRALGMGTALGALRGKERGRGLSEAARERGDHG